jgi:hypothetical protein
VSFRDLVRDTLRTLWARQARTFPTMFGIAWGIVAITPMVAAGEAWACQYVLPELGRTLSNPSGISWPFWPAIPDWEQNMLFRIRIRMSGSGG